MNLYITADTIGTETGGGVVTYNEFCALKDAYLIDGKTLGQHPDPFRADHIALELVTRIIKENVQKSYPKIAHFYAGTFTKTVRKCKEYGIFVTYTAAAHDPQASQEEFASLGIPYNYPHITNRRLWEEYITGYKQADVVICPSKASQNIMKVFGCSRVVVIPHGINPPIEMEPIPKIFTVGYLGQCGPDKGLQYLFKAWGKLQLSDAILLLAGRGIEATTPLARLYGGGNIHYLGAVKDTKELYDSCTIYCQPSVTEGFGIEVLEAMAHGRPCIVSAGAGAADVIDGSCGSVIPARDPDAIANTIRFMYQSQQNLFALCKGAWSKSWAYTWDKVKTQYDLIWRQAYEL